MASQLDVCNLALLRLGQGKIVSLSEGSVEANYLTQFWDADRRAALRDYAWNFAASKPTLLTAYDNTAFDLARDFVYVYALPSDCIRALELFAGATMQSFPPTDVNFTDASQTLTELMFFKVRSGRTLVTNLADAYLQYTKDITDVSKFDDQFVEALSYRLAVDLALPITGNAGFANAMTQLYRGSLLSARKSDATERRDRIRVGRSFLQSRR